MITVIHDVTCCTSHIGESYAGKYVPALAYKIHVSNPTAKMKINLCGVAIGNGLVDPENQLPHYGALMYANGLIDSNQKDYIDKQTMDAAQKIREGDYYRAFEIFDFLLNGDVFKYPTYFQNVTGCNFYFNILQYVYRIIHGIFSNYSYSYLVVQLHLKWIITSNT